MPQNDEGDLPQRRSRMQAEDKPLLQDLHLRIQQEHQPLLRVSRVPLRDNQARPHRLRVLQIPRRDNHLKKINLCRARPIWPPEPLVGQSGLQGRGEERGSEHQAPTQETQKQPRIVAIPSIQTLKLEHGSS